MHTCPQSCEIICAIIDRNQNLVVDSATYKQNVDEWEVTRHFGDWKDRVMGSNSSVSMLSRIRMIIHESSPSSPHHCDSLAEVHTQVTAAAVTTGDMPVVPVLRRDHLGTVFRERALAQRLDVTPEADPHECEHDRCMQFVARFELVEAIREEFRAHILWLVDILRLAEPAWPRPVACMDWAQGCSSTEHAWTDPGLLLHRARPTQLITHESFVDDVLAPYFATRDKSDVRQSALARDDIHNGTWVVLPVAIYAQVQGLGSVWSRYVGYLYCRVVVEYTQCTLVHLGDIQSTPRL